MHVAEAPLERAVVENRSSTGAVIEGIDDLASLVNRPRRSEADHRVLRKAQLSGLTGRFPDLGETAERGNGLFEREVERSSSIIPCGSA